MLTKRFEGLDVVRTLLAVLVALGHFFLWNGVVDVIPGSFFLAVDFFFVLSGFVLTQSVLADRQTDFPGFIKRFALRRVFRLYPLYLLVYGVTCAALLYHFGWWVDRPKYFFLSLFLLHGMGPENGAGHLFSDTSIGISWSLSVELWVGLVFFAGVFLGRQYPRMLAGICVLLVAVASFLMIRYSPYVMDVNLQRFHRVATFGEIRGLLGFSLGYLAYITYQFIVKINWESRVVYTALEIATLVVIVALYGYLQNYDRRCEYLGPYIAAFLVVILATGYGGVARLLARRELALLRPISYAIYLIHPFFVMLYRVMKWEFTVPNAIPYLSMVIATAIPLYFLVEKKGIELGKIVQKKIRL